MAVVFKKLFNRRSTALAVTDETIELSEGFYESKNESTVLSDSDIERRDEELLISSTESEDGVYDDYEKVLNVVGFGPSQCLLLFAVSFVVGSDAIEVLGVGYILQFIQLPTEFGITNWQSGLLSSVVFIGMLIGGYVWGGLADITGRRTTLIMSLFVNSLFAFISSLSPNFYTLLVFRFISGVGYVYIH